MDGNAIVITGGILHDNHAKTTHGLIRGSSRYNIVGVIDENHAGKDAGEVIDGKNAGVAVYSSIDDFKTNGAEQAQYCIIGVATKGGTIPPQMQEDITKAIDCGYAIVNGLHEFVSDIPHLRDKAREKGVELIDIRKPRPKSELEFWSGRIKTVNCPVIAVLGTDCALGKRTTAIWVREGLVKEGVKAEMVYTGQTGWLGGYKYGFIFDSTYNDFISGEIENAVVECYENEHPEVILLEGQSSLRNPSGPCGSEFIVSGEAKGVILQHAPARTKFTGLEDIDNDIPTLKDEIALIKMYGAETIAVTLNSTDLSPEQGLEWKRKYEEELGIPVILPLEEGVSGIMPAVHNYINNFKK